jgi:hypothetical protein
LTPEATFGCTLFNLSAPTIGRGKERLPQAIALGVAYQPLGSLLLAADVVKDVAFPTEVHLGVSYQILDCLSLRAGATDQPSTYSAGIGVLHAFFTLDYGFAVHSELGFTHSFSLTLYPNLL